MTTHQRFRAGSLSFTAPINWSGVTLGQFLDLNGEDAPDSSAFVITTLSGLDEDAFRSQPAPYDFDAFVLDHLSFIGTLPSVPDHLPTHITVGGQIIKLPKDLGATALIGQMWDIQLVIRQRQSRQQPVDPASMASDLLCVFLWPLLRPDEVYQDRHKATEELWPIIKSMNCVEGLAASGFFLRSSLTPLPSGRISTHPLPPTPSKRWPLGLQKVLNYFRTTTPLKA